MSPFSIFHAMKLGKGTGEVAAETLDQAGR